MLKGEVAVLQELWHDVGPQHLVHIPLCCQAVSLSKVDVLEDGAHESFEANSLVFTKSSEAFIQALNEQCDQVLGRLANKKQRVTFLYSVATKKKASIDVFEDNAILKMSDLLRDIPGFKTDFFFTGPVNSTASVMVDVNQDCKRLFIYCDLVHPRPVGDVMVPLLRTLPMVDHKRELVHAIFDKPHHIPLSRFQFEHVEILITSDTGQELAFPHGHTVVTLHFRRSSSEAFLF